MTFIPKNVKEKPYGPHWAFGRYIYAVLPKSTMVFPVCVTEGFAGDKYLTCDSFSTPMTDTWYVHVRNMYIPDDYNVPESNLKYKKISEFMDMNSVAVTYLNSPKKRRAGILIDRFIFNVSDLQPYIKN